MMKIGSLFAGIGGIDLAFEQAGFEIAWANEIDSDACKTYRVNFPYTYLLEADITKVNKNQLPDIDILTAGFPCQPFSVCGYQRGFEDKRGNLFFQILDVIDAKRPKYLFLENVANLMKHDDGKTFDRICDELVKRCYYLKCYAEDACDYGLAQHRTRTYIIGFPDFDSFDKFEFPEKHHEIKRVRDVINYSYKVDGKYYFVPGTPKYEKLNKFIDDTNQIYRFSDYGIQKSRDGISFTLKANMGTWYDREPIIKDMFGIRRLTPLECLALQGFPKTFCFGNISDKSAYKQSGNTVCVPLVKEIAMQMKKAMPDMKNAFCDSFGVDEMRKIYWS